MVRAGETSGTLEVVLQRLADIMEKQQELKSRIQTAMAYPILMTAHRHPGAFFPYDLRCPQHHHHLYRHESGPADPDPISDRIQRHLQRLLVAAGGRDRRRPGGVEYLSGKTERGLGFTDRCDAFRLPIMGLDAQTDRGGPFFRGPSHRCWKTV
jgi:hypothetical protein